MNNEKYLNEDQSIVVEVHTCQWQKNDRTGMNRHNKPSDFF
jgi:hypothetical protein